jgi:hypothetical protein
MSSKPVNRPAVKKAIDLLNMLASRDTTGSPDSDYEGQWNAAQRIALKRTADKAREFIVSHMQRDWNKEGERSSAGGEPPAKRTGSLAKSITTTLGDTSIELVKQQVAKKGRLRMSRRGRIYQKQTMTTTEGYANVTRNTNTAKVIVDENAADRSKGKRLQLYSKYLQTGWVLGGNTGSIKRMDKGTRGDTPKRKRLGKVGQPGRVQPPRPFLDLPIRYNYVVVLQAYYKAQLYKYLPSYLKRFATRSNLTVTYVRPFSK